MRGKQATSIARAIDTEKNCRWVAGGHILAVLLRSPEASLEPNKVEIPSSLGLRAVVGTAPRPATTQPDILSTELKLQNLRIIIVRIIVKSYVHV